MLAVARSPYRAHDASLFSSSHWLSGGFGTGLTKFSLYVIAGCAELFCCSAPPSGEFVQLLCSEQEQNDDENRNHVRPRKIEDIGNRRGHHLHWQGFIPSYRSGEFIFPKGAVGPGRTAASPATICIRDEEPIASWNKIKPSRVLVLEGNTQQCT